LKPRDRLPHRKSCRLGRTPWRDQQDRPTLPGDHARAVATERRLAGGVRRHPESAAPEVDHEVEALQQIDADDTVAHDEARQPVSRTDGRWHVLEPHPANLYARQ